ncbi:MAG: ABC transporter ATP-binding protein [Treponema sp.]|jgi:oligopeptide/dipeptide ABC transporter ATP-binding protein|nr:ABC transporter ATP-binding protein [Treponema sp.]
MPVLSVTNLKKRFNLEAGFFARFGRFVYAVNGVSFSIGKNETYGLVGESGCGKTTTARLLVRMYEADSGDIMFRQGDRVLDVKALKGKELKQYREKVKYVFQDPARSLNPRMTIYNVLTSGPRWSGSRRNKKELREEAAATLEEVGLRNSDLERRPAEFSGGQRQRISIARGLLMKPDVLICDEVVSALDVSIQGQILNLLLDIRASRDLSFLFIAHDLKVACYFCDRIGVMYRGELMEEAPAAELYRTGIHPYTELLFSSAARAGKTAGAGGDRSAGTAEAAALRGEAVPAAAEAEGCPFAARCPRADGRCFREHPELLEAGSGHLVRCFKSG